MLPCNCTFLEDDGAVNRSNGDWFTSGQEQGRERREWEKQKTFHCFKHLVSLELFVCYNFFSTAGWWTINSTSKGSPQADSATCFWYSSHLTTEIVYSCQHTANTLPLLNHNFPITLYSWHKECGVIWEQIRLPHRLHALLIPFSTSHLRRWPLFFWEI